MKNWDSLFGEVPESFSRRVHDTVDRLERQESAPRPAFRLRPVAGLALALCLLAGTAAALSGLGVLDTLGRELRAYLQPEAKELVQSSVFQAASQPRHATFTVEEAVHDGRQMYLSVRVHPESDALLMDFNAEASWSRSWPEHPYQTDDGSETFAQAAAVQGKELVRADCEPLRCITTATTCSTTCPLHRRAAKPPCGCSPTRCTARTGTGAAASARWIWRLT